MAFKRLEVATPQGDGELPWLSELLRSNPEFDGKTYQVRVIAFSQKGMMVTTEYFKAFLYKSNPNCEFLHQALEVWTTVNAPVPALVALVDSTEKTKLHLGIEDSLESYWLKKSETLFKLKLSMGDFLLTQTVSNPFLVSSTPVPPKGGKGRRGKAGKGGQADVAGKAAESLAKATNGEVTMEEPFDEAWGAEEPSSPL